MAKLTISDFSSLANETSFLNALNAAFTAVETAMENTLSRDGTTPNTMSANLDMNSNAIVNAASIQATSVVINGTAITTDNVVAGDAPLLSGISDALKVIQADASGGAYELTFTVPALSGGTAGDLMEINSGKDGFDFATPTSANTASTIVKRDSNARFQAADPSAAQDVATKNWAENTYEAGTSNIADDAVTAAKLDLANLGIPVLLNTTAITAVGNIDFPTIFSDNTGYRYFKVVLEDMDQGGVPTLQLRVSIDGSTFESGASDYGHIHSSRESGSTTVTTDTNNADSKIDLGNALSPADAGDYIITFYDPHNTTEEKPIKFERVHTFSNFVTMMDGCGWYDTSTDDLTGFQLLLSSGTFSAVGNVKIWGCNAPF